MRPTGGKHFSGVRFSIGLTLVTASTLVVMFVPGGLDAQVSWPMFQGNPAHTGYVPVSFDPNDFALDWEVVLAPDHNDGLFPVTAVDGRVYVSTEQVDYTVGEDDYYTLDAEDGSILWSKDFGSVKSVNPPAYDNGKVYLQVVNFEQSALYTFNAESGSVIDTGVHEAWYYAYYAPTIVDNVAYIGGGRYIGLVAFDFYDDPPFRWYARLKEYPLWTPAVDGIRAYNYVGGTMYAISCANGTKEVTIVDTTTEWHLQSMDLAPALGGRNDAFVIHNGRLLSFDFVNEEVGYFVNDGFGGNRRNALAGQVSVAKGVIYAINHGNVEARDQDDGTLLWSWSPQAPFEAEGTMIVTDSHVIVTVVDVDWRNHSDEGSAIHAIDLTTHESVWSYDYPPDAVDETAVRGDLAWSEGRLYLASMDGVLTALKLLEPYEQSTSLQFSANSYSVDEQAGAATVTLRRNGNGEGAVGVTITSEDGSAVAGSDYTEINQTVTWNDGDTTDKTVQVPIQNDGDIEGQEQLILKLHTPTGPTTLSVLNRALLTIVDDDVDVLRFGSGSTEVGEDGGTVSAYVSRSGPALGTVSVSYATEGGTATAGSDYTSTSGTLQWGPGDQVPKTISVSLTDDEVRETDENFQVTLSNPTAGTVLGSPSVFTVTIIDEDGPRLQFESAVLRSGRNRRQRGSHRHPHRKHRRRGIDRMGDGGWYRLIGIGLRGWLRDPRLGGRKRRRQDDHDCSHRRQRCRGRRELPGDALQSGRRHRDRCPGHVSRRPHR